jgi:signal transduction histidine kinase
MAAEPRRRTRRAGTVRVRTTVAAVAVAGVAMAVGALVLLALLRTTLIREARNAAALQAADVRALLEAGTSPGALAVADAEDAVVQILDQRGQVVASSPNVRGLPPLARLGPGDSAQVQVPVEDHPFMAAATAADTPDGQLVVVAARNLETAEEAVQTVTRLLAPGLPLLLVVVAATTWRVVGRALAPVEAIRAEVDRISVAELHRRVPDPAGDDEIARLARTMNRMLDRLQCAQDRQRRFVSDAAHELRSPVASIRQHAEVASAHPDRTSPAELAGTVLAENLRVQRLVEDLLLLTRADEHTLRLRHRPVDLDDLVLAEATRLRDTTGLRVDTSAVAAGRVSGDLAGLRRVLRNLADNAARHARGQVAFALAGNPEARPANGAVVLLVDDDGPGIPEAERARVLERFVRLDDARARDEGGSGLGLAIVAELVAAHGGTVTIADSPLGGARVRLSLPAGS